MLYSLKIWFSSKYVIFYLIITQGITLFIFKPWNDDPNKKHQIIDNDVVHYYSYLPATFIHNDLTLSFTETDSVDYWAERKFWPVTSPNGGKVIKTTMGMSLLYSPFFFLSHLYASFSTAYEANGFTKPYEIGLALSCLVYLFIGFFFLRKALLKCYSDNITSFVLISIFFGTNLFHYVTKEPTMSHAYTFSLAGLLMYFVPKWLNKFSLKSAIFFGLLSGLLVLIRPTNVILLFMVLLYGVNSKHSLKERFYWVFKYKKLLLLSIVMGFLVLTPQLFYWKTITGGLSITDSIYFLFTDWFFYNKSPGYWIFNSYVGEQFYFNDPKILEFLFSYRKGWLLYTPIMCFFILGMYRMFKSKNPWAYFSLFSVLACIFIFSSWWSWWYGGGFGMRCMIDFYPVFAFGLASNFSETKRIKNLAFGSVYVILIGFNFFQTQQYKHKVIHWDSMSKESYWAFFGKIKMKTKDDWEKLEKLKKQPDYQKAKKGEDEYDFSIF